MKESPLIVVDTNVLVSALRSDTGASYQLLSLLSDGLFDLALSVPLVLEYEAVLLRKAMVPVSAKQIGDLLDYLCGLAHTPNIHYLWRPHLPDPKDDMVLELAFNANANAIVTHKLKDFVLSEQLSIPVLTPKQFLTQYFGASS